MAGMILVIGILVDDGIVIDAWGDVTRNYQCHSMRKSLLSALYGIAVDKGEIDRLRIVRERIMGWGEAMVVAADNGVARSIHAGVE